MIGKNSSFAFKCYCFFFFLHFLRNQTENECKEGEGTYQLLSSEDPIGSVSRGLEISHGDSETLTQLL